MDLLTGPTVRVGDERFTAVPRFSDTRDDVCSGNELSSMYWRLSAGLGSDDGETARSGNGTECDQLNADTCSGDVSPSKHKLTPATTRSLLT